KIRAGAVLVDQIAAISAGHCNGARVLDLDYREDSAARVDMNVVATLRGGLVEVQATAEGEAIPRTEMDAMVDLALAGVTSLGAVQRGALARAGVDLGPLFVDPASHVPGVAP